MKPKNSGKAVSKSSGAGKISPAAKAKKKSPITAKAKAKVDIPPILLEGDAAPPIAASGPGVRYSLGPQSTAAVPPSQTGEPDLPEAYGTQRLVLTARDPNWLYAHWDLTRQQQLTLNKRSAEGHLVLRIYRQTPKGTPFSEIALHPESRNWFVHVGIGDTQFVAELGYYPQKGKWVSVSQSGVTLTPPDKASEDVSIAFETLPPELQFSELLELVKAAVRENIPLMEAIQQLRVSGFSGLPKREEIITNRWTPAQEATLAKIVNLDSVRQVWMGSLEITEVIRRQLLEEMGSVAVSQLGQAGSWSGGVSSFSSLSSPFGGMEKSKGFWFNVNAELVIYGATEPDASVTIGGRSIKLRPDGTFSYRFALPDGQYFLPAVATAADGTDQRVAELTFKRASQYFGDVGKHPQDAQLKPPSAENVS